MQTVAILPGGLPRTDEKVALVSPMFDALFVCGAMPFALALLLRLGIGINGDGNTAHPIESLLTVPYMVASLLIGESHQFTSITRYTSRVFRVKEFDVGRLATRLIYGFGVVLLAAFAAFAARSVVPGFTMPDIFSCVGMLVLGAIQLFPAVLAQHVLAQSRAIGQRYCNASGYNLTVVQHILQRCLFLALVATAAATFAIPFSKGVPLPLDWSKYGWLFEGISLSLAIAFALTVLTRGRTKNEWPPQLACLLWMSNLLLIVLPTEMSMYVWLFAPVFMHATQHWTIAWTTKQKELSEQGRASIDPLERLIYFMSLALPSVALSLLLLFGKNMTTLDAISSMVIFYLHYFTDRVVWRPAWGNRAHDLARLST